MHVVFCCHACVDLTSSASSNQLSRTCVAFAASSFARGWPTVSAITGMSPATAAWMPAGRQAPRRSIRRCCIHPPEAINPPAAIRCVAHGSALHAAGGAPDGESSTANTSSRPRPSAFAPSRYGSGCGLARAHSSPTMMACGADDNMFGEGDICSPEQDNPHVTLHAPLKAPSADTGTWQNHSHRICQSSQGPSAWPPCSTCAHMQQIISADCTGLCRGFQLVARGLHPHPITSKSHAEAHLGAFVTAAFFKPCASAHSRNCGSPALASSPWTSVVLQTRGFCSHSRRCNQQSASGISCTLRLMLYDF
jgi:hypothetical protein